jgi:Neisseria PilC beta-propeller domain
MNLNKSLAKRLLLYSVLGCMVSQTALAAVTDISSIPLATSGGSNILPNLLFDLDDSGSMQWDFMPDYVSPNTPGSALTQSKPCMVDSSGQPFCSSGCTFGGGGFVCNAAAGAPYEAGGASGFNGVGYDPNFYYRPGLGSNGQPLINPPSGLPLGNPVTTTSVADDIYFHAPFGASVTNVDVATQIPELKYCNNNNVCMRNGADSAGVNLVSGTAFDSASSGSGNTMPAGQFPYRTNPANASNSIFGLPEMMPIASFTRSLTTVTATTVAAHGLATTDKVYVSSPASVSVTCVAVTAVTTNTFTYSTTSSGSVAATDGSYRKCDAGSFVRAATTVTVTETGHGLAANDIITTFIASGNAMNVTNTSVTAVTSNTFTYTTGTTGVIGATAGFWVRTGLYNVASSTTGPGNAYAVIPVEYCSDANLTNCAYVLPGNTPPAGFNFPAYVRFCQTQAQAVAPGAVSDSSGTPRCRSKYNETAGITQYLYVRHGWFKRDIIKSTVASYTNRPNRADCISAPTCTYAEEVNNYARWYTYYRTRLGMMKSSVGTSFLSFIGNPTGTPPKPNSLRIGLITMHSQDSGSVAAAKYLKISDFNTTQASNFYTKFYTQTAGNATPLQQALARAGWIFAGKLNTGLTSGIPTADDPIQAACQRNFTLLTTDGYWNQLASFLPQTPAARTIGNLDASPSTLLGSTLVDRPQTGTLDASGSSVTTVTPISANSEQDICQGNNAVNFGIGNPGGPTTCNCLAKEHKIIQEAIQTLRTDVFNNGVLVSSTTGTNPLVTTVAPGCQAANWTEADTPQTVQQDKLCQNSGGGTVTFSDGTTKSCSLCKNKNYVIIRQTKTQTNSVITADGVQTQNSTTPIGTPAYTYSTDGTSFSGTQPSGNTCPNSSIAITLSPNPKTTNNTPVVNTNGSGTALSLWSPNPQTSTGGTVTSTFTAGGTASTVADVAMYFYETKLRGGTDVYGDATGPQFGPNTNPPNTVDLSTNSIIAKSGAKDFVPYQHMVTFGIGLADGLMRFQPDYETASTGDFANIKNGALNGCFWTAGACNWPAPADNLNANLDDLWHAAVNGRGAYYQALNPDALRQGISAALTSLNATVAAAAASATSSPNVTQTDNQIFSTTYETNTWSGKVFAQTIDPVTGNVNPAIVWQADQMLLSKVAASSDSRNILTLDDTGVGSKVKSFAWASLTATEQAFFSNKCTPLSTMTQCALLTPAQQISANDGSQMVGFLRGWQANEGTLFRDRVVVDTITGVTANTVLGDTITARPVFVHNPTSSYVDAVTPSYATFAAANANRASRVYVGANDGYLHAFDGSTGSESWAYAPRFILPAMYSLADTGYPSQHRYFVDGSPEVFDVFDAVASAWKTILIGGLDGGGRGFYALDITDPVNPKGLWEFCNDSTLCAINDADLGLSYGNPVVGKRSVDGKWIVVLSSGLNNVSPGSGIGYFYVLDAITGAVLNKVSTGAGTVGTPSGLMKISAFFDSPATDATFRYAYAGDQLGDVFRIDMSTNPATVLHIATLKDGSGRAQPITTRPALTHIGANRVMYIGTGRYLGNSDLTDPGAASGIAWQQTLYGFKDKNVDYGTNLRTGATLVTQTLTKVNATDRGISSNPVDWNTQDGWLVDFNPPADPTPGEGVNLDPRLVLGTVKVITNIPSGGGACAIGGSSIDYDFDFRTGSAIATAIGGVVGRSLGGTIAVGMAIIQLPSGAIKDIITGADTSKTTVNVQINAAGAGVKRFSYRER